MLKATGASSYVWNTGDSVAYINVCPEAAGEVTYSVEGCRAGCCNSASVTFEVLGIDSPEENTVILYPNPARDRVTVQAEQMRSVELITLMGQTVMRQTVQGSSATLDLQKLPKGIYFVKVETANSVGTQKLVLR